MLHRLRSYFIISHSISALKNFSLSQVRNTLYPECRSGQQAWLDLPRSTIKVNNVLVNFDQAIQNYEVNNPLLQNNDYRDALHTILQQTIFESSGIIINPSLIDELITLLHQACLHGSLYTSIMSNIARDVQDIPENRNTDPIAALNHFATSILVLSPDKLYVKYSEQVSIKDGFQSNIMHSGIKGEISFNITSNSTGVVSYDNANVHLLLPQSLARVLLQRALIRMSNLCTRIRSFFHRQQCNDPTRHYNLRESTCRIADTSEGSVLLLSTPSNIQFTTVTSKEMLQQKEIVGAYGISNDNQNESLEQPQHCLSSTTTQDVSTRPPEQQSRSL
ncbi:hypothetical protein FDZ58_01325 [Ehrlichia ruminantium]|uniref:hypothetical protein n=1 Tax=Ehrlichia ruminantium TaxID=779 RepID=UPI0015DCA856|nr:hypothetical protein [Ehrlichia ruminantium]QLK50316.1 hypothetical protein FDZ68_01325 [Ehrlichia ruminantium]QLK51240.1 hypothetical protein FDZ66_01330 [Ehrlichia ruminantium]QLK53075.1 hypothetical protein FDZ64_01325 [Ehrlichia ruminantium]QLK58577.1 hypothetical protein FDZ58_01325 [Ehrlichia ruminantium]